MIHVEKDTSKGFLNISVTKETSSKDFIDLITLVKTEKSLPKNISLLINALEGFENVRFLQLGCIADAFIQLFQTYNCIAVAMVINNKRERTLSVAFQKLLFNLPCHYKTFSNLNDAKVWLDKNQTNNDLTSRKQAG